MSTESDRSPQSTPLDTLPKLVGTVLAMLVLGFVILAGIDVLFSLIGGRGIGYVSGWATAFMCLFTFTEEFKRHREAPARVGIAGLSLVIGVAGGIATYVVLPDGWLPLYSGAVASAIGAIVYAVVWHFGIDAFGSRDQG
ncbi:hypothetical protein [Haloglycomyces albus]|uniref:hypothetical protein n=1 Tax=Haloglycomyces albus TaxID=526067 RepID=UPI00046D8D76|nr:hypothetical protein [Haloglycomyces albus]